MGSLSKYDAATNKNPDKRNKGGRPKGSKNKSTILAEAIKGDFERSLKANFREVMKALLDEAKNGNIAAIKLLFDKVVPNAGMDKENVKKGDFSVNIVISDMAEKEIKGEIVEDV